MRISIQSFNTDADMKSNEHIVACQPAGALVFMAQDATTIK